MAEVTGVISQLGVTGSISQLGVTGIITEGGDSWSSVYTYVKSGVIWYRREINATGGYFVLSYSDDSGVTWEDLMTLALTEDSIIIDLPHNYSHRVVGTEYRVDYFITALGYTGVEGTDWENLYST